MIPVGVALLLVLLIPIFRSVHKVVNQKLTLVDFGDFLVMCPAASISDTHIQSRESHKSFPFLPLSSCISQLY